MKTPLRFSSGVIGDSPTYPHTDKLHPYLKKGQSASKPGPAVLPKPTPPNKGIKIPVGKDILGGIGSSVTAGAKVVSDFSKRTTNTIRGFLGGW